MKGKYRVVVEDYYRRDVGKIVAYPTTVVNARKTAYEEIGKYGNKQVSVYKEGPHIAGPLILVGEVQKWYSGERYWYPSDDGHTASAGKYVLYKSGKTGKRLR